MNWEEEKNLQSRIVNLKSENFTIIALEQNPKAQQLGNYEASDKFALIVGNEVSGVSKEALELADDIVEISMTGAKESLNVSVATGVALYHLMK